MKKSVSLSSTERVLTDITELLKYPILSAAPKSRANKSNGSCILTGAHNEERKGGKEREAPTHFIEISELSYAARITKNRHNCKVCSQEK